MPRRRSCAPRGDRGVIVVGWLFKLVVTLAIVGVIGYDALGIAIAQLGVRDDAEAASQAAYQLFKQDHNAQAAYDQVLAFAKEHGETVPKGGFAIAADGAVTVRLQRKANTLVASRIPQLKQYVVAVGEATARNELI